VLEFSGILSGPLAPGVGSLWVDDSSLLFLDQPDKESFTAT
jgi:hypothetical protein